MKKEDLLKILADAGLKDEEILALCQEIIEELGNKEPQPAQQADEQAQQQQELAESEDDKRKRIFGI